MSDPVNLTGEIAAAIEGRARVVPELDQEVYEAIVEPERQQDPERHGVAVVIDVDSVAGAGENGFFQQGGG